MPATLKQLCTTKSPPSWRYKRLPVYSASFCCLRFCCCFFCLSVLRILFDYFIFVVHMLQQRLLQHCCFFLLLLFMLQVTKRSLQDATSITFLHTHTRTHTCKEFFVRTLRTEQMEGGKRIRSCMLYDMHKDKIVYNTIT